MIIKSFNQFVMKNIFLLEQLVVRDFKLKYKRSFLGVLWSFLNPLLMLTVQYIVFSTLFSSAIVNFPLYLMTGIVIFNYFNETITMSILSIISSANLIKKVSVPTIVFPVARVLSSTINLMLSFVPIFLVMIFTKSPFSLSMFLLPLAIILLLAFCMGLGMFLSALMVFFQDVQFLWRVLSLLWMYATPIFYPREIIPERFSFIVDLNPLYHLITLFREVIITGVVPNLQSFMTCIAFSFASLFLGLITFLKLKDKFYLFL